MKKAEILRYKSIDGAGDIKGNADISWNGVVFFNCTVLEKDGKVSIRLPRVPTTKNGETIFASVESHIQADLNIAAAEHMKKNRV